MYVAFFIFIVVCATSSAFVLTNQRTITRGLVRIQSTPEGDAPTAPAPAGPVSKGFGTVKPKVEKEEEAKDAGTMTYEAQAKRGVPEYNIFLRPTNGSEAEWTPVGSMTIPRDTAVSKAVFEVEEELLKGAFKLYPKLKAFWDVRSDKAGVFEYGHCLKAFPDEEIKLIVRETAATQGNFFSTWLGKITNPLDTEDLKNKGQMTLNQNK